MNYIKEAENRLYYYQELQKSIDEMRKQISRLISKSAPSSLSAALSDETGVRVGRHDNTYNTLYEIQTLQDGINQTEKGLNEIDSILNSISADKGCELYGKVLRKWYIERLSKEAIAYDLNCSIRNVYYVKDAAIRKFAVRIFGIKALQIM